MTSPPSSPSPQVKAALHTSSPHSTVSHNRENSSDIDIDPNYTSNVNSTTRTTTPNTSISNSSPTNSTRESSEAQKRIVAEIIAESFPPFDHQAAVVGPYEEERRRDLEFNEQLVEKLFSLVLKAHAWSSSRPTHQSEREAIVLEKGINDVIAIEREQEHARERLRDFISKIKLALAALTGLTSF